MAPTLVTIASLLSLAVLPVAQAGIHGHGHLHAHHHYDLQRRQANLAVTSNLPTGWSYQGCWTDKVDSRALPAVQKYTSTMTQEFCISWCSGQGYPYAGVEYSDECYCAKSVASYSTKADDTDCNMACSGNSTEVCGGPNRLNLFKNDTYATTAAARVAPSTNIGPAGWGFIGCFVDDVANRTMEMFYPQQASQMTVAMCTGICDANAYNYSGVEYGGECFCSNSLDTKKAAPDGLTGCNMVCNGNETEYCGGSNRLNVYGKGQMSILAPRWADLGCYTDVPGARTLRYQVGVTGGYTNMTNEGCQTACYAAGYTLAGTEYSQECWCDNSYQNGGHSVSDGCTMACKGNANAMCGGPNRLNVFSYNKGAGSTTTSATASATATSTASTTSSTPLVTGIPTGWSYKGCYIDNAYGRILGNEKDDSQTTVESCIAYCKGMNMTIAGIEYSTQCFCGTYMANGGKIASQNSDCNMACGGNSAEICGGPSRMSIYASANFTTYNPPKAVNTSLPANWTYKGCLAERQNGARVLPYQIVRETNMTVEYCLNRCAMYGYSAAALEYGQECYCGDDTDRINAGVAYVDESRCDFACSGVPDETCGGALVLNYYTSPQRDSWGQKTGNAAGAYQFFIGGVVIPLITTVGVNGKVTFIEKHGTGPPNSTGAYELDPSLAGNFNAAWRTMNGVKTDVFCSAGLTLPDKAGRQINIGGWSTESLFGIRLYSPDGSPGKPSVNDWQENVDEVKLQVGRWYPSAMQLVNGSILVVGGEDGSNGAPVPSLEVVPKPAGGSALYMDWLQRTDPNNLYPFLTVLPTGNIAVFYYNEARILDEKTFATIRTLPNIPGAVNNDAGGRTYPLEGTSMLLPQYAPYTDPLEVLICGGSTPFGGNALDNCVTIQPEVAGANWTIERMPSRRVISCMTALPDGTYLILNGAEQGVAGFGLANEPNHNALLYDPSKPKHSRISRLANTTIDRLYHSEAILLPDGRVLVSGSDPEDNTHVQEYRVEVFIPPYLMGNPTRPTFNFSANATDWSYGKKYTIKIGNTGDCAKVALMASVSSTHGNSMGQRSIFPAFSCSGTTCTITAPPNGYITGGPGWHMLFVLNAAGVPSVGQWVRIGGDPAGLGNWPNFPDFKPLPGV